MNLYYIQDDDRPMYVVAQDWGHALKLWRHLVGTENNLAFDDVEEPNGISLICQAAELILPEVKP